MLLACHLKETVSLHKTVSSCCFLFVWFESLYCLMPKNIWWKLALSLFYPNETEINMFSRCPHRPCVCVSVWVKDQNKVKDLYCLIMHSTSVGWSGQKHPWWNRDTGAVHRRRWKPSHQKSNVHAQPLQCHHFLTLLRLFSAICPCVGINHYHESWLHPLFLGRP